MRLVSDEVQQEALVKIKRLDAAGAAYREISRTLEGGRHCDTSGRLAPVRAAGRIGEGTD